jgi:hypothetical protein
MSSFYNPNYDLQEAAARRRRETARRSYEFDVSNIGRKSQQSITEMNRQYRQGLEPRATGFTRRGLGRSGLFRRAMSQYAADQQRGLQDITQATSERLAGLRLQEQQSAQELQDVLDSIARAKAQEIYASASTLRSFQPFTGLYS